MSLLRLHSGLMRTASAQRQQASSQQAELKRSSGEVLGQSSLHFAMTSNLQNVACYWKACNGLQPDTILRGASLLWICVLPMQMG